MKAQAIALAALTLTGALGAGTAEAYMGDGCGRHAQARISPHSGRLYCRPLPPTPVVVLPPLPRMLPPLPGVVPGFGPSFGPGYGRGFGPGYGRVAPVGPVYRQPWAVAPVPYAGPRGGARVAPGRLVTPAAHGHGGMGRGR